MNQSVCRAFPATALIAVLISTSGSAASILHQLDAADNTGSGSGHDNSLTTWTATTGGLTFTFNSNAGLSWVGDGTAGNPYAVNHPDNGWWGALANGPFTRNNATDRFSIEAWVRSESPFSRWLTGADGSSSGDSMLWGMTGDGDGTHHGRVAQLGGGNNFEDGSSPTIPDAVWTHMVMTFDSGSVTFYYNGTVGGSGTTSTGLLNNSANNYDAVLFGKNTLSGADTDPLRGDLSILRIYDDVLTSGEVSTSYLADKALFIIPETQSVALVLIGLGGLALRRRAAGGRRAGAGGGGKAISYQV